MNTESELRQTLVELADLAPDECDPTWLLEPRRPRISAGRLRPMAAGLLVAAVIALVVGLTVARENSSPPPAGSATPMSASTNAALTYAVLQTLTLNGYPKVTARHVRASSYAVRTTYAQLLQDGDPPAFSHLLGVPRPKGVPLSAPVWIVLTFGFDVDHQTISITLVDARSKQGLGSNGYTASTKTARTQLARLGTIIPLQ